MVPALPRWFVEDRVRDGLWMPARGVAGLAVAVPGSRLLVYHGTGHLVLWERQRWWSLGPTDDGGRWDRWVTFPRWAHTGARGHE